MTERLTTARKPLRQSVRRTTLTRAFTLVELMVAVTGGIFVSMVVFALARDGSRFYQRESRVAEATLAGVIGFDRLHNDIGRAGFLSSPNLRSDPSYCGDLNDISTLTRLRELASIQITLAEQSVQDNPTLRSATPAITPHSILLAGAYDSVERFDNTITTSLAPSGSGFLVRLQVQRGALFRMGYTTMTPGERTDLVARLFPPKKALRFFNTDNGTTQYGIISRTEVGANNVPQIYLEPKPNLILSNSSTSRCSARLHQLVNVVNFVRYTLRKVKGNGDYPEHQQLFEDSSKLLGEDDRLELVREELYPGDGSVVPNSREIVAEYAVDLRLQTTCITNPLSATPTLVADDTAACKTLDVAAPTYPGGAGTIRPQSVRSLRVRLSIRSREADRTANIDQTNTSIAPGLYRIGLGANGASPFARVRTLQADTFLASHSNVTW